MRPKRLRRVPTLIREPGRERDLRKGEVRGGEKVLRPSHAASHHVMRAHADSASISASRRAATDGQCVKRRNDRKKALTMARMDCSKRPQSRSIGGKRVQDPRDDAEVH
jgi:hypothetical protein